MRYFYIFILTLILISCNEKKSYSLVVIKYGEEIKVKSESECRDVVVKGKIIRDKFMDKSFYTLIYHKGFIYKVYIYDDSLQCYWKRKLHDK